MSDIEQRQAADSAACRHGTEPAVFRVPQSIAIAMATDRSEFCQLFADNEAATENEKELARLIGTIIEDRQNALAAVRMLQDNCKQVHGQLHAMERRADTLEAVLLGEDDDS